MNTDRKVQAEKNLSKPRGGKGGRRAPSSDGQGLPVTYEHAPIGIVEASLTGEYINVNEEFCRIIGYGKEELLRHTIKDFTHDEDYAIDVRLHEQLVAGKIPFYRLEKRFIRKSGESIWVELTRSLVCDEVGKPLHSVGVVLDISDRKHVERVLRESVERLRLATEAAGMFTWEWDFQRQIYKMDDNFEKALGFSAGLLPQNQAEAVLKLSPPEDMQIIAAAVQQAIETRSDLHSLQYRMIDPGTGQLVWLEANGKIVYDEQGNPERMFGVARNITEDKKTLDEIAIISRFPAENPHPVMRLTPEGKPLFANDAGRRLLESWKERSDRPIPEALRQAVTQAFASGFRKEIEIPYQDRVFSCTLAPILEAGYVNFYGNDITERKRAEAALQLARKQAEQSADRTARLQKVTAALSAALTPPQVAEVLATQGALSFGAVSSSMMLLSEDGQHLELMHSTAAESVARPYQRFSITLAVPAADAVRSGELVWIESQQEYLERYPHLAEQIRQWGQESAIAVPMFYEDRILGVFTLSLGHVLPYNMEDREYVLTLARQGAQALERARAEIALRESEERFRALISQATAGITETDMNGTLTFVNPTFCEMLDYSQSELLGKTIWQFTYPDDLEENMRLFDRMLTQSESYQFEKRFIRRNGTTLWTSVSVSTIRDLAGNPKGGVGVILDIDERKHAEDALAEFAREQVALYKFVDQLHRTGPLEDIYNAALDAIISALQCDRASILLFDEAGVMRFVAWRGLSDQYRRLTDGHSPWKPDEQHPEPISMSDVNMADLSDALRAAIKEEGIGALSFIPLVSNGRLIGKFMVYFDEPHLFRDDELDLSLTIARQLAFGLDRKRAEETLRRNEELFSTLIQTAPFGVYFIDSEFRLRAINKGSEAVFKGVDPLIGRDFAEILRTVWQEPFATEAIEHFRHTLRTGESFISPPIIEPRANIDEIQSYDWQIHRVMMPDGGYGVVCYFYDLSEHKRMEAAVRASESLYRAIARSIPGGGIYVVDKDFRYLVAEGPVTEAFGLSREMLEGRTVTEAFPDERGERMAERLQRNLAGETISFETKHNGRVYWTRQAPLSDSIGQVIILTLDITERKQAEEALRESEERLRAILRQATAGIVRKDAEGRLLYVNQAFCNMLGYTESDLVGKMIWDFMHPDDVAENKRSYDRLMMEGIPFKLERRFLREDGSLIWVDASVSPIMDAAGRPQSAVAVEVDITGRKQAEEALQQLNLQLEERVLSRTAKLREVNQTLRAEIIERKRVEDALRRSEALAHENETKLRSLFELLPVGISFLGLDGQVIQMNAALLHILKLSKEQFLNDAHKSRTYIRPDGTPMSPREFASARAIAEQRTIYNVETGILLENGDVIWTSVSAAPVNVADVSVVVVTVDVTENKRAEQALQESHARLRVLSQRLVEVQEEERRALARELHDRVGQTLAALNINLIIINSQLSGDAAEQIGTRLNDSMKLVAETISLVRDVMTDLRPAVLDDYGLEAAIDSHLSQFIARYDIRATFDKPSPPIPRLGPSVEMTFLRIAQEALINIARHARATQVNLSLRQEEDAIYMTIQDNGIGIQSWQEANRPGSHGLTIMRERAEAFGGALQVTSIPGQGTRIEVSIPLKDQANAKRRATS